MKERFYGESEFRDLTQSALQSERLRLNRNIHDSPSDPCQRLFISMLPRSYVIPHRHTHPAKSETFVVLRGSVGMIFFDNHGAIRSAIRLGINDGSQVCDIPPGVWHTAISFEVGTVFLEVKPGPFDPINEIDVASWAPAYGSSSIDEYLDFLYAQFDANPDDLRRSATKR